MVAPRRPQLDKMGTARQKPAPMSRTSGVARRLLGRSEGIATKLKYGAPLTGSASGVKSISLKDAGEVLTSGIVTLGKKGLKFAPEGLAMALPIGKVLKARNALALGGKITKAVALDERLAAKAAGKAFGQSLAERKAAGGGPILKSIANEGLVRRGNSQSVFPRFAGPGTTVRRGRGTVNQEGLEKMIAGGREPSRDMLRIPQILKGTNKAYESIAQKAIKAAGLPKRPRGK